MAMRNVAHFVREAVESVLQQIYRDFELIVVDDASDDQSAAIIAGLGDARVKLVQNRVQQGAAASRNVALSMSRGTYIAVMDADDICSPVRLERQVDFLTHHPEVGIVGCSIYDNIDDTGQVLYTSSLPQGNQEIQSTLLERWCFLHPSIMFRRDLIAVAGAYRTEFDVAEDHDFILRILEHTEAHNLPERLMSYRLNPRGLSVTAHRHINAMGDAAIRLAKRRRMGEHENLDIEVGAVRLGTRLPKESGLRLVIRKWQDSIYAASRYYGFGCLELCEGRLGTARCCFLRSISTSPFFLRSWLGVLLASAPFAAAQLRFLYRNSMRVCRQG